MRYYPDPLNPMLRVPYYERGEIEQIVTDEMRAVGLNPCQAAAFCPEGFLMERFGCGVDYLDFPENVHGEAVFSVRGLEAVRVNRALDEASRGNELRLKTTLAHEAAGHGLLHQSVIVPELTEHATASTFRQRCTRDDINETPTLPKPIMSYTRHRALEFQANYAMGVFCMPKQAVLREMGNPDTDRIPDSILQDGYLVWVELLQAAFVTSKPLTQYRLNDLFPALADLHQTALRG